MDRIIAIFTKAGPLLSGLVEVGKTEEARTAALNLFKTLTGGKNPTPDDLDRIEKFLDAQLDKFNEELPSEEA